MGYIMTFINYSYPAGCSVATFRNSGTSCGTDIVEFARSVQRGESVNVTIRGDVVEYQDTLTDALCDDTITYDGTLGYLFNLLEEIDFNE